jgi:uncharacterized phage protein (TIGR01671 family)
MSREIKFRALDIHNKAWHLNYTNVDCMRNLNNSNYVVTQFTGLLDKNGREVFENDIVRFWANPKDYGGYKGHDYIASVEWDEFNVGFILSDGHGLRDFEFLEVIGNIYQNPELLGGQDE